jgi:hypothetical protein
LVVFLSHFLELEAKLELLRSRNNTALTNNRVDALWILARPTSDLLASHVLPSIARGPPDGTEE